MLSSGGTKCVWGGVFFSSSPWITSAFMAKEQKSPKNTFFHCQGFPNLSWVFTQSLRTQRGSACNINVADSVWGRAHRRPDDWRLQKLPLFFHPLQQAVSHKHLHINSDEFLKYDLVFLFSAVAMFRQSSHASGSLCTNFLLHRVTQKMLSGNFFSPICRTCPSGLVCWQWTRRDWNDKEWKIKGSVHPNYKHLSWALSVSLTNHELPSVQWRQFFCVLTHISPYNSVSLTFYSGWLNPFHCLQFVRFCHCFHLKC